mmetsp:Transcript_35056/g.68826  ORF Transcript_35056/g.68826 Transcript_35056/m.68826 type:complete len:730 (+) Transcript_35056:38-2227(+)
MIREHFVPQYNTDFKEPPRSLPGNVFREQNNFDFKKKFHLPHANLVNPPLTPQPVKVAEKKKKVKKEVRISRVHGPPPAAEVGSKQPQKSLLKSRSTSSFDFQQPKTSPPGFVENTSIRLIHSSTSMPTYLQQDVRHESPVPEFLVEAEARHQREKEEKLQKQREAEMFASQLKRAKDEYKKKSTIAGWEQEKLADGIPLTLSLGSQCNKTPSGELKEDLVPSFSNNLNYDMSAVPDLKLPSAFTTPADEVEIKKRKKRIKKRKKFKIRVPKEPGHEESDTEYESASASGTDGDWTDVSATDVSGSEEEEDDDMFDMANLDYFARRNAVRAAEAAAAAQGLPATAVTHDGQQLHSVRPGTNQYNNPAYYPDSQRPSQRDSSRASGRMSKHAYHLRLGSSRSQGSLGVYDPLAAGDFPSPFSQYSSYAREAGRPSTMQLSRRSARPQTVSQASSRSNEGGGKGSPVQLKPLPVTPEKDLRLHDKTAKWLVEEQRLIDLQLAKMKQQMGPIRPITPQESYRQKQRVNDIGLVRYSAPLDSNRVMTPGQKLKAFKEARRVEEKRALDTACPPPVIEEKKSHIKYKRTPYHDFPHSNPNSNLSTARPGTAPVLAENSAAAVYAASAGLVPGSEYLNKPLKPQKIAGRHCQPVSMQQGATVVPLHSPALGPSGPPLSAKSKNGLLARKAAALGYGNDHGLFTMYTQPSARFHPQATMKVMSSNYSSKEYKDIIA